jgi:hypothetical protein
MAPMKSMTPATFSHATRRRHVGSPRSIAISAKGSREADDRSADARWLREEAGEQIEGVERQEHDADHAPALHRGEEPQIDASTNR